MHAVCLRSGVALTCVAGGPNEWYFHDKRANWKVGTTKRNDEKLIVKLYGNILLNLTKTIYRIN